MLGFFRKYQKYFYVVITFVIVISFSFFGTFSAMQQGDVTDPVVFTAIDGTKVMRSELDELVMFIGTDNEDKVLFGGIWGPNFLNDGVIKKDVLETGLAELLVKQYGDQVKDELKTRSSREKSFKSYAHPQADFITAVNVWQYMAPEIHENFQLLKKAKDPVGEEAFRSRVKLFIAERNFPSPALRQTLKYQEKQYPWVREDANLNRIDLSLFGYHTIDDWFGQRFQRLVGQYIINSAKIAQQKGYEVTEEEALADLIHNAQISYRQNSGNPNLGVANSGEYFNEQLRRMRMDQKKATKIWRQILLFRRLYQDAGNSVIVDPMSYQMFANYANETLKGELYQLPEPLRFNSFGDLQRFEFYLDAVTKRGSNKLDLPREFKSVNEVKRSTPELVQKRYLLDVAEVNRDMLITKVGVKETWDWQVKDENWAKLKKEFPDLGISKAATVDERLEALDNLSPKTRMRVDRFARDAIIDAHPEWIGQALALIQPSRRIVGIRKRGGQMALKGVKDRTELIQLLDANDTLDQFTGDQNHFYRINVIERGSGEEIVTFEEVLQDGLLDEIMDREYQVFYLENRRLNPGKFQQADGTWKDLRLVRDDVAELYFADLLKSIGNSKPDHAAANRLKSYMEKMRTEFKRNPKAKSEWILEEQATLNDLSTRPKLNDQWKLVKSQYRLERNQANKELEPLFALEEGSWSVVMTPPNGDISFFELQKKGAEAEIDEIADEIHGIHKMISHDAQKVLMKQTLNRIASKNAISLDYMNRNEESQ